MSSNILYTSGSLTGTVNHPAILVLIIVSFILIPLVNIRYSVFIMIFLSIIIPLSQRFEVFTLDFYIFRVLVFAGWIKIIFNKNFRLSKFEKTDKVIIYWVIVSFIAYIIQQNNINAVINQLGFAYNAIGVYFLYRIIIKRKEDISTILNTLAIVSAVVAVFMLIEQWTGKNLIYVFWGEPNIFSEVRLGRIRSQGPFAHSINAGVFGATMAPLYFSMWRHKWGSAFFGIMGTLSAFVLVITSSSTTPLIAGVAGFAALLFWPLRNHMRRVRYGILFTAVLFQIIMISPIWAFISQINLIRGSSAFHRYQLVDNLINRVNEWFLIGYPATIQWGVGMDDLVNQYFKEAVQGGFLRLVLFITIIVFNFGIIGKNIIVGTDISSRKKFWAFGSSLFAILVSFFGIGYWDQMLYVWYLFLALITSTSLIDDRENFAVNEISKKLGKSLMSP